jgi:hypothetical protein
VVQANPMALEDGCWDLNRTRIYEPAAVRRDQLVPLR